MTSRGVSIEIAQRIGSRVAHRGDDIRWLIDLVDTALNGFVVTAKPEVYSHLSFGAVSDIRTALCGKVWRSGADVAVVGKCPECVELADDGWYA